LQNPVFIIFQQVTDPRRERLGFDDDHRRSLRQRRTARKSFGPASVLGACQSRVGKISGSAGQSAARRCGQSQATEGRGPRPMHSNGCGVLPWGVAGSRRHCPFRDVPQSPWPPTVIVQDLGRLYLRRGDFLPRKSVTPEEVALLLWTQRLLHRSGTSSGTLASMG
jgi:hypothetical protein